MRVLYTGRIRMLVLGREKNPRSKAQGRIYGQGAGGAHPHPPLPQWDEPFFFAFTFKICLPRRSVTSFLRSAPPPKRNPRSAPEAKTNNKLMINLHDDLLKVTSTMHFFLLLSVAQIAVTSFITVTRGKDLGFVEPTHMRSTWRMAVPKLAGSVKVSNTYTYKRTHSAPFLTE